MDITTINDLKELKALAYDQLTILEQAKTNLKLITARINEVEMQPPAPKQAAKDRS